MAPELRGGKSLLKVCRQKPRLTPAPFIPITPSAMKHTHPSFPDRAALPTMVFAPYRERWVQRRNKGAVVAKNASSECIGGFLKGK